MKNTIFVRAFLAVMVALAVSCSPEKGPQEATLDVTPNNIAGVWRLHSWSGGDIAEGAFVYIDFQRSDRTYTLYQSVDTHYVRTITGSYYIYTDAEEGAIIRGNYDYGNGDWARRYVVSDLTADRMVWTALDNRNDVSVYVRSELPSFEE